MKKETKQAINLWKEFVSKNHHKNRDFDYVIFEGGNFIEGFSEGYTAVLPVSYLVGKVASDTWSDKDLAIIDLILSCFLRMDWWCEKVIENKEEYDEAQIEQAEYYFSIEKELDQLRAFLLQNDDKNWDYRLDYAGMLEL